MLPEGGRPAGWRCGKNSLVNMVWSGDVDTLVREMGHRGGPKRCAIQDQHQREYKLCQIGIHSIADSHTLSLNKICECVRNLPKFQRNEREQGWPEV